MLEIWTMCCGYLSAAIRLAHEEEAAAAKAELVAAAERTSGVRVSPRAHARRNTPVIAGLRGKSIALRESRPPL